MQLTYNGYTFNDQTNISINTEIDYDGSGRVATQQRLTITARSTITPSFEGGGSGSIDCDNNDDTIQFIRDQLGKSSQSLELTGVGFGDLIVNKTEPGIPSTGNPIPAPVLAADSVVDIMSGPVPRTIQWTNLAGQRAAEIVWTVTVVLSPDHLRQEGLKSLNYTVGFSINQRGFTTKTVRGHIEVVQAILNGAPLYSADDYRDQITVTRSTNMHREQDYNLSADRSRLDFSIVDKEIESPNAYPAGVVSISAPLRMRIPFPTGGGIVASNSVQVSIELEAQTARHVAWLIFTAIFASRVSRFGNDPDDDESIIVTELSISEDTFSHKYSFSVSYKVTGSFNSLMTRSGLFEALPADWGDWSASMSNAQRSRGQGQFKHSAAGQDDKLIGLCDDPDGATVALEATEYFRSTNVFAILCNENPPAPDRSWIKFDAETTEATSYNRDLIQTYGKEEKTQADFLPTAIGPTTGATTLVTNGTGDEEVFQSLADGATAQYWTWKGHGLRVGYPIPRFGKTTVGTTPVEITGEPRVMRKLRGFLFCQPVYEVAWSIGLVAMETPDPLPNEGDLTITNNDFDNA